MMQHSLNDYMKDLAAYRLTTAKEDLEVAISDAEIVRHESGYDDFFIASKERTQEQINTANELIDLISNYVNNKISNATQN